MDATAHDFLAGLRDEFLDTLGAVADTQLVANGDDWSAPETRLGGQQLDQDIVVGELLAEVQFTRLGAA